MQIEYVNIPIIKHYCERDVNMMERRSNKYDDLIKVFNIKEYEKYAGMNLESFLKKIVTGPVKNDFTPRTIKGISNVKIEFDELLIETSIKIDKYLNSNYGKVINKDDFDNWHKSICNDIVAKFNEIAQNKKVSNIYYGKAQKIVNMTFKYLFCYDKKQEYNNVYPLCHMPIDSYILRWCINQKNVKEEIEYNIGELSWSNFDEKQYLNIQTSITKYLEGTENITLPKERLFAEFYIWPGITVYDSINNLINTIDKNNLAIIKLNKNTISDLENSMNEIKKVLNI